MRLCLSRFARLFVLGALLGLPGLIVVLGKAQPVQAFSGYLSAAEAQYPSIVNSRIDNCQLCHPSGGYKLDAYAQDYANAGRNFTAIEQLDSDGDGFKNIAELIALTYPGNASDRPAAQPTSTPTQTAAPPTSTPTQTAAPPTSTPTETALPPTSTPTQTTLPPTSTPTQSAAPPTATATATSMPPTATVAAPSATATPTATSVISATSTPTAQLLATATATAAATTTLTPAPTATPTATPGVTAGPTPTSIPLPPLSNRLALLGRIESLPESESRIGTWDINDRKVNVSAETWIEYKGLLREHSLVWVLASRTGESSANALYIRVLTDGEDDDDEHDDDDFDDTAPESPSIKSTPALEREGAAGETGTSSR